MNGILLVAHGSRSDNSGLERLARTVMERSGLRTVLCYKRFGEPKVRQALRVLVESEVDDVTVIPLFMSDGRYVQSIPRNLGLAPGSSRVTLDQDGHRIDVKVMGPVGLDAGIGDVVLAMVKGSCPDCPGSTGVVLVGHGPSDDDRTTSTLEGTGYRVVRTADGTTDGLACMVDGLRRDGRRSVVVVPMRFGPMRVQPMPDVLVTGPIGTADGIVDIICRMVRTSSDRTILDRASSL